MRILRGTAMATDLSALYKMSPAGLKAEITRLEQALVVCRRAPDTEATHITKLTGSLAVCLARLQSARRTARFVS